MNRLTLLVSGQRKPYEAQKRNHLEAKGKRHFVLFG